MPDRSQLRLRRVSHEYATRAPNPIWNQYLPLLEKICEPLEPMHLDEDSLRTLYTTRRLSGYSQQAMVSIKESLVQYASDLPPHVYGYTEADIIVWLFSDVTHLLLYLVGSRGVGKTSLIHYLFRGVWQTSGQLKELCPIIVDLRQHGRSPSEVSILYSLVNAVDKFLENDRLCVSKWETPNFNVSFGLKLSEEYLLDPEAARLQLDVYAGQLNAAVKAVNRQLVIVFDNCDQASPAAITLILSLARSLTLNHRIRVIIPMRPFTERSQIERECNLGGFFAYSVSVMPPDILALLTQRVTKYAPEFESHKGKTRLELAPDRSFEFGYGESVPIIQAFIEYFVKVDIQHLVVMKLCNNDMRRALIAIRSFLRSRTLPAESFLPLIHTDTSGRGHMRLRRFHLLKGIMVDDRIHYRDDLPQESAVILDIFDLGPEVEVYDYLIQLRILSLLAHRPQGLLKSHLIRLLRVLGRKSDICKFTLHRLLRRGLISSPEHDEIESNTEFFRITETGNFYLEDLVKDPEYLFQVVYDIPLLHKTWNLGTRDEFEPTVGSLFELLECLIKQEKIELDLLKKTRSAIACSLIPQLECVSSVVYAGIRRVIKPPKQWGHTARTRDKAGALLAMLEKKWQPQVQALKEQYDQLPKDFREIMTKEQRYSIQGDVNVILSIPEKDEQDGDGAIELCLEYDSVMGNTQVDAFVELKGALLSEGEIPYLNLGWIPGKRSGQWHIRLDEQSQGVGGAIILAGNGVPFGEVVFG